MLECTYHQGCYFRPSQVQWAGTGMIQERIHSRKGLSSASLTFEHAIRR